MPLDVSVDTREIRLVEHGELEVERAVFGLGSWRRGRGGGRAGGEVEVEGALEDGGVGDGVDGVEGEEEERFLEGVEDAGREEEEEAFF